MLPSAVELIDIAVGDREASNRVGTRRWEGELACESFDARVLMRPGEGVGVGVELLGGVFEERGVVGAFVLELLEFLVDAPEPITPFTRFFS